MTSKLRGKLEKNLPDKMEFVCIIKNNLII